MMKNSTTKWCLGLFVALALSTLSTTAAAELPPDDGTIDAEYTKKVNESAGRVSLGYDQGMVGRGEFVQGLKLEIPFSQFFGMRVRPLWMHAGNGGNYDPSLIGRVGLYGSSPVLLGVVRIYGGGGPHFGWRPFFESSDPGNEFALGGGGFFGWEFFMAPRFSFSLEVGGQSAVHGDDRGAGASVMAGVNTRF